MLVSTSEKNDEHPLGGTDCRINESRSAAAGLHPSARGDFARRTLGLQRVSLRKPSGLRTHTLICLGTTVVLLSCSAAGISLEGASRVIQGIVTGIGFIGAGSILKLSEDHLVSGLTVSTRIWTTAAVGIAIGLGRIGIALIATVLIIMVLAVFRALERQIERHWRVIPEGSPYDSRP